MNYINNLFFIFILTAFITACGASKEQTATEDKDSHLKVDEDKSRVMQEGDEPENAFRNRAEKQNAEDIKEPTPYEKMKESLVDYDYKPEDFRPWNAGEDVHKLEEGDIVDGKKQGTFRIHYTNGFTEEGIFEDGIRQGEWKIFNRDREHVRTDYYKNGNWQSYEIIK